MILVKASTKILTEVDIDILKRIERAGRTCYKSESKLDSLSSKEFIAMIVKKGHESVLEHESISVLFICDRGVSHELVRHRLCSFSQESTRYCNYASEKFGGQLSFIVPPWVDIEPGTITDDEIHNCLEVIDNPPLLLWLTAMRDCEQSYLTLLELGWQPQQARSVLPNSLKTEIVVTANLRQWRTMFKQRTSKAAHPQMRELMIPLLSLFQDIIPIVFDDIIVKE